VVEFEVNGLSDEEKARAIEEINRLVENLGVEEVTRRIVIASDFAAAAKRFLPAQQAADYDPQHEYGRAIAKTISHVEGGRLSFTIVFDASLFVDPANTRALDRHYYVIHELVHVQNGWLKYRNTGRDPNTSPTGKAEYFTENGWRIWEEYCSERLAAEAIAGAAKSIDPHTELGFAFTIDFANDALRGLDDFGRHVPDYIRRFRLGLISIAEATAFVTAGIGRIAIQLAYVYALIGIAEQVAEKVAQIEMNPAYRRFFRQGWGQIVGCFIEFYGDRHTYRRDIIERMAEGYETVLLSSGLEITDVSEGYYVRVVDI